MPSGTAAGVNVHDFPDKDLGKAIPYGIYDVSANTGWVSVGTDHDTSAFAVATLRNWWQTVGRSRYPTANQLLICADGGGSNGSRVRAWKIELSRFAAETGLHVRRSEAAPYQLGRGVAPDGPRGCSWPGHQTVQRADPDRGR